MIRKGDRVCVAVSGGADSMCLLFLLNELSGVLDFSLSAVHVEHGIRGQASLDDMEYVENQCRTLGIPVETARVDSVKVSETTGTSLEEAARNERYRILDGSDFDKMALAHHMDDQAETFLFNAVRGTGLRGLRGITPVRGRYIRPLLCVTRDEIEKYCREKQIEYRHDQTNEDLDIARNRIRHIVVPELIKINSGASEHICETAEELAETDAYLDMAAEKAFEECTGYEGNEAGKSVRIDLDKFDNLHGVIASRVVKKALITVSGKAKDIGRKHIEAVLALAKGQSGRHISLIYGIKAYKEFRTIVIAKKDTYELPEVGSQSPPDIVFQTMDWKDISMEKIISSGNYTKFIDYAKINDVSALSVRHRQPGDHISIKNGSKKLKDLLIEEKIPGDRRNRLYLVAMGSEAVWIPDIGRIGERFKVSDDTKKILRMEIKNG